MEKEEENFDPDDIVIKEEPMDSDGYGVEGDTDDDDNMLSRCPPGDDSDSYSDHCEVKFSSTLDGASSDSDVGDACLDMSVEKHNGMGFDSVEGDSFQVISAADYYAKENDDCGDVSSVRTGEVPPNGPDGNEYRSGMDIKEEQMDPQYHMSYTYAGDYLKEESHSPVPAAMPEGYEYSIQQDYTYSSQQDSTNSNEVDHPQTDEQESRGDCGESPARDGEESGSQRSRRRRHKVKRLDGFEYEDNYVHNDESSKESDHEAHTDTDKEHEEERGKKKPGFSKSAAGDEPKDANMIAQYAIFDPDKSEMVGIKSVNPKKCDICGKEFNYEFHKKFHMQQVHPDHLESDKRKNDQDNQQWNGKVMRYSKTCFICMNKIYTHPYYLNLHMQEMHPEWLIDNKMIQSLTSEEDTEYTKPENKNKVCPVCFEGFQFAFQLKYHIQKKHAEILVADKRVDTSTLPSRTESEFPITDARSLNEPEGLRESLSESPVKLTYTVKDLLNIKRNIEKENEIKEAKLAQRVARSLEPRRGPGRPRKPPSERKDKSLPISAPQLPEPVAESSKSHGPAILRRKIGRPKKIPVELQDNKLRLKLATTVTESESAKKSNNESELNLSTSLEEDSVSGICDVQVKEEPVSYDEERTADSEQSQESSTVNPEDTSSVKPDADIAVGSDGDSDKNGARMKEQDALVKHCGMESDLGEDQKIRMEDDRRVKDSDVFEAVYSGSEAANVISFDDGKHSVSNNKRLEFNLNLSEPSTSNFAVTDSAGGSSSEKFEEDIDSACVVQFGNELVQNKPKRKRKKKELQDILPQIVKAPKRKKKKMEKEFLNDSEFEASMQADNTITNPLTPKTPRSISKPKKSPKVIQYSPQQKYCSTCGKIFNSSEAFRDHEPSCTEAESPAGYYPCRQCSVVFKQLAAYQLHVLKDHADSSKTCPFCGKLFAYPSVMKKHMYIHTNETVKKAITAIKDDENAEGQGVNMEKDSKLVGLITSLGVQGEVKPETECRTLELSVPLKPVSTSGNSVMSIPGICTSEGRPVGQRYKKHDSVPFSDSNVTPPKLKKPENCDKTSSEPEASSAISDETYSALKQALANRPKVEYASTLGLMQVDKSTSNGSSLGASPTSVPSPGYMPQKTTSLVKSATEAVSSSTSGSDADSSISSIASKLPFSLCPEITSASTSAAQSPTASSLNVTPSSVSKQTLSTSKFHLPSAVAANSSLFAASPSKISKSVVPPQAPSPSASAASPAASSPPVYKPRRRKPGDPYICRLGRTKFEYPCKLCDQVFPDVALLYKHEVGEHHKHVCPHCVWCGKSFNYLKGLKNHVATHNGLEGSHRLKCSKCSKVWYDMNGNLPGIVKECIGLHLQECFVDTPDSDDMLDMYMTYGDKSMSQKCIECDLSYKLESCHSRSVMIAHVYRCKICEKDFDDVPTLKEHIFAHHSEAKALVNTYKPNRAFNCGSCSEKFKNLFEFMCHMTAHKKAFKVQQPGPTDDSGSKSDPKKGPSGPSETDPAKEITCQKEGLKRRVACQGDMKD